MTAKVRRRADSAATAPALGARTGAVIAHPSGRVAGATRGTSTPELTVDRPLSCCSPAPETPNLPVGSVGGPGRRPRTRRSRRPASLESLSSGAADGSASEGLRPGLSSAAASGRSPTHEDRTDHWHSRRAHDGGGFHTPGADTSYFVPD